MSERENLIKSLKEAMPSLFNQEIDLIAGFIIEDRKLITKGYDTILSATECCKEDSIINDIRKQCKKALKLTSLDTLTEKKGITNER